MSAIADARRASHRATVISCLSLLAGVGLWQWASTGMSTLILPPPADVAAHLFDPVFFRRLSRALGQSLIPLGLGFAIALAIAAPLGILIGRSPTLGGIAQPVITVFYAIPPIAFVPFLVVWFGLFFEARLALVVLMTVFDVLLVIIAGARDVPQGLLDVGRSFGARGFTRMRLIVLPALSPFLFAGLRVGFARAVNGMITAELFFAAVNLGAVMKRATQDFDTAGVLLVVLVVCLLGLLGQTALTVLETRLLHWHVRR